MVLVGSFNPAIFHPEWFLRHDLIGQEDAREASVNVVSKEVGDLLICGVKLFCIPQRLSLGTANISRETQLKDLLLSIVSLLPHTPIEACGINPWADYRVESEEHWHRIGHALAPKDLVWNRLAANPGMRSLTITAPREGEFPGELNMTVEPSTRFRPGILVRSNYHWKLPAQPSRGGHSELLLRFLHDEEEWKEACGKARSVADVIFDSIKANG